MKYLRKIIIGVVIVAVAITGMVLIKNGIRKDATISIDQNSLTLTIHDKVDINKACGIRVENTNQSPFYTSGNVSLVKIDPTTGVIECLASGQAVVSVNVRVDEDTLIREDIDITILDETVFATNAVIEKETVTLTKNSTTTNQLSHNGSNLEILVRYENSLVTYDPETGVITSGNTAGTDTVFVYVPKNETEYFILSFTVEVRDNVTTISKTISLNSTTKIDFGDEITAEFVPNMNDVSVLDDSILTVLDYDCSFLIVNAKKVGTTTIAIRNNAINVVIDVSVV